MGAQVSCAEDVSGPYRLAAQLLEVTDLPSHVKTVQLMVTARGLLASPGWLDAALPLVRELHELDSWLFFWRI